MQIPKDICSKGAKAIYASKLRTISHILGKGVDMVVLEIFSAYRDVLVQKPVSYIVPAVWGAVAGGELDAVQKEIHDTISPAIAEILNLFEVAPEAYEQAYAIRYLVNGYLVAKFCYMLALAESAKDSAAKRNFADTGALSTFGPVGRA